MQEELYRKKSKLKNHILDKAYIVFSQKSYSSASLRDLMQAANVSRQEIAYYFKNKIEIFLALEERFDFMEYDLIKRIDFNNHPEQAFKDYLYMRLKPFQNTEYRNWICLSSEFWSLPRQNPKIEQIINKRRIAFKQDFFQLINNGITKGVFIKDINLDLVTYCIVSTIIGVALVSGPFCRPITDQQIDVICEVFLSNLRRQK
ncbi:TetR/AcrR family transcriptional regulator [Clostridium sp. 'deep sea']|uniref:TetR/AcrR family transcriptional regulator n=1 Tax=Clostridium sp. 'deep sea' TaxID=2779445 RepID=UPI0018965DA1|nr:TetR/AcrR family transcriptional regulator [Clostridium sp. 'deep sea']QOR34949.1 TetR/AcrR family transcriptional regulator [Clostridium sp. 'deep sea']